jgi:chitodextrinase
LVRRKENMKLKKYYTLLKLFIALALVLLAAGCGGTDGSVGSGNAETGAITAKLNWIDDTSAITNNWGGDTSRHILSAPAGVVTVRIIVSGSGMSDVQKDFAAAVGQGTVDNIPVGSSRTLTASGLNASGNAIAQGAISNITIVAGQTTDAGTITMQPTPPSTPTGFAVTAASSSQINLSWNASTGATGYKIYKGGSLLKSVAITSTSDTGLSPSTNYCYYVTAYNSAGESTQTSQACATTPAPPLSPPSTPTGFAVTAASSSEINLSWNASTGATGYKIYKGGSLLKSVTTISTSDTGLSPATNYCYYVTAYNAAGESTQTSQVCATTLGAPITTTGTWRLLGRCSGASSDVWDLLIYLNESAGGSFSGSASGTDYNGTPMQMSLNGTYNNVSKLISFTATTTFTGNHCVRIDTGSTTLTSNDTGYFTLAQIQICGCTAQMRMIKQ